MDAQLFARLSLLPADERWTVAQNNLLAAHSEPLIIIGEPSAEVRASIVASVGRLPSEADNLVLLPSPIVGQTIAYFSDWRELGVFLTRPPETEPEKLLVRGLGHAYAIWKKLHE
jgi:hypothetical protein